MAAWGDVPEPRPLDSVLPLADLANMCRRLGHYTRAATLHAQAYQAAILLVGQEHPEIDGCSAGQKEDDK